jgi:hypothetical protein
MEAFYRKTGENLRLSPTFLQTGMYISPLFIVSCFILPMNTSTNVYFSGIQIIVMLRSILSLAKHLLYSLIYILQNNGRIFIYTGSLLHPVKIPLK